MNGVFELDLESVNGEHIWMVGKGSRVNRVACWNIVENSIKELEVPDMEEDVFDPFYAPICTSSKIFYADFSPFYI